MGVRRNSAETQSRVSELDPADDVPQSLIAARIILSFYPASRLVRLLCCVLGHGRGTSAFKWSSQVETYSNLVPLRRLLADNNLSKNRNKIENYFAMNSFIVLYSSAR